MRIGIDLGGTKIEGILLDEHGVEKMRKRIPTPQDDYSGTVKAVGELVDVLKSGYEASVGVGIPGAISAKTGFVKNANSVCLIGQPLGQDIEQAIGQPVRLANDANCFAMSEATDGAGKGAEVVFGVILGTGVGGGIIVNGHPIAGANAIAGEWGHNPLPWPSDIERPGPGCYCGNWGCIETFLSGPGLANDHNGDLTAEEIAQGAANGDSEALATIGRYEHRLARALASVINILDPDVIVLGGGLSNIEHLYTTVPRLLETWVFSDHVRTKLVKNMHGDSSGVRGAAWLWN